MASDLKSVQNDLKLALEAHLGKTKIQPTIEISYQLKFLGVDLLNVEKHCHLSLFDSLLQKNWYLEEVYDCEKACSNFNAKVPTSDEFHQLNIRKGFEQNW